MNTLKLYKVLIVCCVAKRPVHAFQSIYTIIMYIIGGTFIGCKEYEGTVLISKVTIAFVLSKWYFGKALWKLNNGTVLYVTTPEINKQDYTETLDTTD